MSAVVIQFDPAFAMGPRSVFPWPGPLDTAATNHNILGADLNSLVSGSDASLTPPSETRSLASSPPRLSMTPEQQEMRRHRDRVRRESKLTSRMRRTDSASYTTSPPPMALNDVSNAIPLPMYSTAPQVSLLAEPSQALHSQPYLSSCPYSTTLQEASHTSQMFTSSPYQQSIPSTYSLPMDYPGIYSAPGDFSTRTPLSVAQDTGLLYSMPTVQPISHANYSQEGSHVRVVQSRPKPRCWEHGCNGRQFSTFSNLLRHQREKSGQAAKATCPNCGAEFTRTTARNGHLLHDKCKQRRGNTSSN